MFVSKDLREWLRLAGICLSVAVIAGAVSWTVAGLRTVRTGTSEQGAATSRELPLAGGSFRLRSDHGSTPQLVTVSSDREIAAVAVAQYVGDGFRSDPNVRHVNYIEPTSRELPHSNGQQRSDLGEHGNAGAVYSRPRRLPVEVDDESIQTINLPQAIHRPALQLNQPSQQTPSALTPQSQALDSQYHDPTEFSVDALHPHSAQWSTKQSVPINAIPMASRQVFTNAETESLAMNGDRNTASAIPHRATESNPFGLSLTAGAQQEELPLPSPQGIPRPQQANTRATDAPGFEILAPAALTPPNTHRSENAAIHTAPLVGNLPPAEFPNTGNYGAVEGSLAAERNVAEPIPAERKAAAGVQNARERFAIDTAEDGNSPDDVSNWSLEFSPDNENDRLSSSSSDNEEALKNRTEDELPPVDGIGDLPPNISINISSEHVGDDESEKSSRDLLLQSARNALKLGDFDKATKRLTEYLRRYPDDGDARIEFAFVLQKLGRFEAATKQFEHLIREFPNNYKFKRRYADLQLEAMNYALAEPALRELLVHPDYRMDAAIDLARLLSWTQRTLEAAEVYEAYLANAYPNEKDGQLQLAELLVEIKRPALAMELLLKLHIDDPVDLRVLKLMIMVSAKSDNPTATYEFIEKLRTVQPENVSARNELAKQLLDEGFHREAVMVDQQILDFDPAFTDALIRSVQASLRMFEPGSAQATLKSIANPDDPEVLVAKGEYHALIGEYADAIAIYHRILARNPNFVKAQLGLGHAFVRSGQFLRAAGEFGKVLPGDRGVGGPEEQLYVSAQLAQARAYAHARHFEQAIAIIDQAMATDTATYTDQILDAYVDVMTKAKRYGEIVTAIQSRLPDVVLRPHRERQLQSRLGLAMARNRDYSGALQEFESLESDDSDPIPEAVYGKNLALRALGSPQLADESLNRHFGLLASDTYLRVRIAELATEDCDCCLARRVLERLNRCCDQNVLIANRIGEACMMCAACEDMSCCAPYFQGVLLKSPTNVQAMMGLARIHTRQGGYETAEGYFERAIATMTDDINLVRELARMRGEWQGPQAAAVGFSRALQMTTGEHLYEQAQASPERVMEFEQDYERLSQQGVIISTETETQQLAGWKPLSQINTLEGLFALEPTNTSSLFQIGQAYSHLNRTQDAICAYERVLCVNPCHQEAKTAIARARLEMSPQVHVHSRLSHQRGRDDLTAMDAGFGGVTFQWPLGDEDEFVQLGYEKSRYDPPFGRALDGDTLSVRVQHKPAWCMQWWAQANYEQYDFGFEDRITFDVGWSHRYIENASYRVVARQQNVIENFESIDQDIHRLGFELGHNWQPTRRFTTDVFYRYWDYSDDNFAHNAGLYTGYILRFGRQQLRWLTNFDWTDFDKQTILPNAPFVDGAIYPYFAPDQFFFVTGGLECKRFLSCDTFKGANRHWYELFLGARMDNDGETYWIGRGQLGHDIYNWLSLTAFANVIQSPVYDLAEGGARLTMRF